MTSAFVPNMPYPPPVRVVQEAVDRANIDLPGEILTDAQGRLLKRYLTFEGFTAPSIQLFNNWLEVGLPRQLQLNSVETRGGKRRFRVGEVSYIMPMTTQGAVQIPLLPRDCRERSMTYAADVYVRMVEIFSDGDGYERVGDVLDPPILIGSIPVLLGSMLCHLANKSDRQLKEMGEDPDDPMGYFIVKGTEKILLTLEKLRAERVLLFADSKILRTVSDPRHATVCQMTCSTPKGTSMVKLVVGKQYTISLQLYFLGMGSTMGEAPGNACNDDPTRRKRGPNRIGAFQAFRMLGISSVEEMVDTVLTWTRPEWEKRVKMMLLPSIACLGAIPDDEASIAQLQGVPLTEELRARYRQQMETELFPHMDSPLPSDFIGPDGSNRGPSFARMGLRRRKLTLLGMMICRIAEYLAGLRELDDRDNWGNKRLEAPARSMERLISKLWGLALEKLQLAIFDRNLADPTAFRSHFDPTTFTEEIVKSFTSGNWGGSRDSYVKENITDTLKRDSLLAAYSHLSTVVPPTNRDAKQAQIRMVQFSQLGYIDPADTPEGAGCGILKKMAIGCYISLPRSEDPIRQILYPHLTMQRGSSVKVLLNGYFMGWSTLPNLRQILVNYRRSHEMYRDMCVVEREGILFIHTDGSRPTRPLLVVGEDGELIIDKIKGWDWDFSRLLGSGAIEYIDAFEQQDILLAQSVDTLRASRTNLEEAVKRVRQIQSDASGRDQVMLLQQAERVLAKQRKLNAYTHCEMDPMAILGVATSIIPVVNTNQAPRNTYQANMGRQALGPGPANLSIRFDTTSKVLMYPSRPVFETQMNEVLGLSRQPAGEMVTVAIMPFLGFNQEDACVLNKASVDNGMFMYAKISVYRFVEKTGDFIDVLGKNKALAERDPDRFAAIGDDGVPFVGSVVRQGDCVIGALRYPRNASMTGTPAEDIGEYVKMGEDGVISEVLITSNAEGSRIIKVKITDVRRPELGDKFASRFAQKSTVGAIIPAEDLPFTEEGLRPDIIINPHAIPSRMTIGKLIEIVTSKNAVLEGQRVNATGFRPFQLDEFMSALQSSGFRRQTTTKMINGMTGKEMPAQIFIGPCYYQALRHHVKDKIQARALGAIRPDRQPVAGRSREGGLRFGEMESDSLVSHGASELLREQLCTKSDAFTTIYCRNCGLLPIVNFVSDNYVCQSCGKEGRENFGKVELPYGLILLSNILAGANISLRLGFAKGATRPDVIGENDDLGEEEEEEEEEEASVEDGEEAFTGVIEDEED